MRALAQNPQKRPNPKKPPAGTSATSDGGVAEGSIATDSSGVPPEEAESFARVVDIQDDSVVRVRARVGV